MTVRIGGLGAGERGAPSADFASSRLCARFTLLMASVCVGSAMAAPSELPSIGTLRTSALVECIPDPESVVAAPNTQSDAPVPAELAAAYDAAATAVYAQVKGFAPAAVVGVRSPLGTWQKAYGVADLASGAPATTDMHQHVASITKTFTGTVLWQLAVEGKLSLDDPIANYVPEVPNGSRITLRQLVTMTSGLGDYVQPAWEAERLTDRDRQWMPEELLAAAWKVPTSFPPGTDWEYSNINYVLLGLTMERVTGQPLRELIAERILDPLHLSSTHFPVGEDTPQPLLRGYTSKPASVRGLTPNLALTRVNWFDVTDLNLSWEWAAGQMTSRMDDLLVWGRVLATGQGVLPPAAQVQRLQSFGPSKLGAGELYGEALQCKDEWIGHGGNTFGYNSMLRYNADTDTTIAVEATGLDTTSLVPRLVVNEEYTAALARVAGHPYKPQTVPVPRSHSLAGRYEIESGRKMHLECHGTGSPTVVLIGGLRTGADYWERADRLLEPSVYPQIGQFTRVCSYDRPGTVLAGNAFSRSDPVAQPTTETPAVRDLHALLETAGQSGPYVLAAHSYGGFIARLYASTYPDEVSGMVLIDALSEEFQTALGPTDYEAWKRTAQVSADDLAEYPGMERLDFDRVMDEMRSAPVMRNLPLTVLSADRLYGPMWQTLIDSGALPPDTPPGLADAIDRAQRASQTFQAHLVPWAVHITDTASGHDIPVENPAAVIDAIHRMVTHVRGKDPGARHPRVLPLRRANTDSGTHAASP